MSLSQELEELPKKIKGKYLCICREDFGWWIGYEGNTLNEEIAATGKTLNEAIRKLYVWYSKELEENIK